MKKQKKVLLITVLGVMFLMGVVYAVFTALTLNVSTTATASASIFSVGFDDVEPFVEKTNENITVNATTPKEGDMSIDLAVSGLKNPGETATVYYTVKNFGDVDAKDLFIYTGPEREFQIGESPNSWISEDGVFEFAVHKTNYNGTDVNSTGENWISENCELKPGEIGIIKVEVKLLKVVDTEASASCTATITANPANLGVE